MLSAQDVTVGYSNRVLIQGVNFTLHPGQSLVITGSNGAGKTTLARVISGLLRPIAGQVLLHGKNLHHHPRLQQRHLGLLLYPERCFYYRMTVKQNLQFFAAMDEVYSHRLLEKMHFMAEKFDLLHLLGQPFMKCSLGERKKVGLLRLLLKDPDVIIMDELTANLDVASRHKVLEEFQKLLQRGKTIIFITHHQDEVLQLGSNVAHLRDGAFRCVLPHEAQPTRLGELRLHCDTKVDAGLLWLLQRQTAVTHVELNGCTLIAQFDPHVLHYTELLNLVRSTGVAFRSVQLENLD